MVGSVMKAPGLLPKIIGILGILLAVKGIFLLLSKTSEKLWAWWADRPLSVFRLQAVIIIAIGVMLVMI
jgi:hypothetical protein